MISSDDISFHFAEVHIRMQRKNATGQFRSGLKYYNNIHERKN